MSDYLKFTSSNYEAPELYSITE